ncbi:MAG: MFS transporter [Kiloniellaceae bacterium]
MIDSDRRQPEINAAWTRVCALALCMGVCGLALGLSYPLFSLVLAAAGVDDFQNGVSGAMTGLGILVSTFAVPAMLARLGTRRALLLGLAGTAACLTLAPFTGPSAFWLPLRFALGCCINVVFIVTEVWLNTTAADDQRGRMIGLYTAAMAAGFAAGPLLLVVFGSEGAAPFLACAALVCLAALPVLPLRDEPTGAKEEERVGCREILAFPALAPLLVYLLLVYALFDGAALVVLPLYFLEQGFSEAQSAGALAALLAGMVVLQLPLGWLLDRLPRRVVIAGCALVAAACCAALPQVLDSPWLLGGLLLLLGGLAVGLYTGSFTLLGEHFSGAALVAGTAAMGVVFGLGNALGPFAAGAALRRFGADSLPTLLGGLFLATSLIALARAWQLARRRAALQTAD